MVLYSNLYDNPSILLAQVVLGLGKPYAIPVQNYVLKHHSSQLISFPLPTGVATHLLLNATALESPGRITGVELLDLGADTLMHIPVRQSQEYPDLYNLTAFMPPQEFFYIKVSQDM